MVSEYNLFDIYSEPNIHQCVFAVLERVFVKIFVFVLVFPLEKVHFCLDNGYFFSASEENSEKVHEVNELVVQFQKTILKNED